METTQLEQGLLDSFQYHFPLTERPFDKIAQHIGLRESQVIKQTKQLLTRGVVSRIGPVFSADSVGANMLAIMSVPLAEIEYVASQACLIDEVTHCYEREHVFNLWFVISSRSEEALALAACVIEKKLKRKLVRLPMLHDYQAALGARRNFGEPVDAGSKTVVSMHTAIKNSSKNFIASELEQKAIQLIQSGIPVCEAPYDKLGRSLGVSGQEFIQVIQLMHHHRFLKRWGVVLRYYELGLKASAVVVWDIPDERLEELGQKIAGVNTVSMCYQRPRHSAAWRYNLFTEINSTEVTAISCELSRIVNKFALQEIACCILFNGRRFKHPNGKPANKRRHSAIGSRLNYSKR